MNEIIASNSSPEVNSIELKFSFGFNDNSFKSGFLVRVFTLYKNSNDPTPKIIVAIVSIYIHDVFILLRITVLLTRPLVSLYIIGRFLETLLTWRQSFDIP